jgi:3-oxoacyl-(acyl-carrier-protein) synthase
MSAALAARSPSPPLAITGVGCIGAPGRGVHAQRAALCEGRSGLSLSACGDLPLARRLPIGRVQDRLPPLPSRTAALAVAAAQEALANARVASDQRGELGVVVGTCTAGLPESERDYLGLGPDATSPTYRWQQAHRTTQAVARLMHAQGPQSTHSVACASSAAAMVEACELIRSGRCAQVLVIGADALTRITMAGFGSLQLVDAEGCRPFTDERHGMSLGEGAAALVVEDAEHARRRQAPILASLLGWGLRADGYHSTTPDPQAQQLQQAIRECLQDGGVSPAQVGYICAHGTGTRDNDACEARALSAIFGQVPVASSKRVYGHTMGACAAIEAVGCCLALQAQRLWPSAGAFGGTPLRGIDVVVAVREGPLDTVCSTTLAFGGVNAALLFGRPERCA